MTSSHFPCGRRRPDQRGVVLLFALIALAIMMIASVALVRSYNTSLFTAGNIAFKRDMRNQAERAITQVVSTFSTGLGTADARRNDVAASNYSAVILDTNADGIPRILLDKTAFDARWTASTLTVQERGVTVATIRYVVDRLCNETGLETVLGSAKCQIVDGGKQGGSGSHLDRAEDASARGSTAQLMIVYRISMRVDGARDSQAFYQATFTL